MMMTMMMMMTVTMMMIMMMVMLMMMMMVVMNRRPGLVWSGLSLSLVAGRESEEHWWIPSSPIGRCELELS